MSAHDRADADSRSAPPPVTDFHPLAVNSGPAIRTLNTHVRSALLVVVATVVLVSVALTARIVGDSGFENFDGFEVAAAVAFTVLGYAVVWRAAANRVGWCLLIGGLFGGVSAAAAALEPVSLIFSWLHAWSPWPTYALLPVALLFFPDGRLPSIKWRWVLRLGIVGLVVPAVGLAVAALFDPHLLVILDTPSTPTVRAAMVLTGIGVLCTGAAFMLSVAGLVVRWRRAEGDTRQQLKWLALGAGGMVAALVAVAWGVPGAWMLASMAVPLTATVAILRYRLYDIDLLINRSFVYAATGLILLAFCAVLISVLASSLLDVTDIGSLVVITVCLVLVVNPLRVLVQRWVNHLLRGHRDDPHAVIAQLGRTIVSTSDAGQLLPAVVNEIAGSLRLPYVALLIEGIDGAIVRTEKGRSNLLPEKCFPMTYQGAGVGQLVVAQRSVSEPLTSREDMLLSDLASHVGIAAHAVKLTLELQRSRERLRRDLEEERRRLRHDLHDSLGPMLAGLVMQAGAGRAKAKGLTGESEVSLDALEQGLRRCVDEVRCLINGLHRPTALDQVGLIGAIHESARGFDGAMTRIEVLDTTLPELPAAVEVAAYRIATEALTNVIRHSSATHAFVELTVNADTLRLRVEDDGRGIDSKVHRGEGLHSMRERAAELGGVCMVERSTTGGTAVTADLPIRSEAP